MERASKLHIVVNMLLKLFNSGVQIRMFSSQSMKIQIGLLGIPYNEGASRTNIGTALAPDLIREGGLVKEIMDFNENVDVKDFGNLPVDDMKEASQASPTNMKNFDGFMPIMKRISEKVQQIRAENRICINLGGDHGLAVG